MPGVISIFLSQTYPPTHFSRTRYIQQRSYIFYREQAAMSANIALRHMTLHNVTIASNHTQLTLPPYGYQEHTQWLTVVRTRGGLWWLLWLSYVTKLIITGTGFSPKAISCTNSSPKKGGKHEQQLDKKTYIKTKLKGTWRWNWVPGVSELEILMTSATLLLQ